MLFSYYILEKIYCNKVIKNRYKKKRIKRFYFNNMKKMIYIKIIIIKSLIKLKHKVK